MADTYTVTLDDDLMVHKIISRILGIDSLPFTKPDLLRKAAGGLEPCAAFVDIHLGAADSGLDIIPELRRLWKDTPIIVITGQSDDKFVSQALATGATDFIRKPINHEELKARYAIRLEEALQKAEASCFKFGNVDFDLRTRELRAERGNVYLSPYASSILVSLVQANGILISREVIKRKVWGTLRVNDNCVDRRLSEIRRGLRDIGSQHTIKSQYSKGVFLDFDGD